MIQPPFGKHLIYFSNSFFELVNYTDATSESTIEEMVNHRLFKQDSEAIITDDHILEVNDTNLLLKHQQQLTRFVH